MSQYFSMMRKDVRVCEGHKTENINIHLLEKYKAKVRDKILEISGRSQRILVCLVIVRCRDHLDLTYLVLIPIALVRTTIPREIRSNQMCMMLPYFCCKLIKVEDKSCNLFFDSECGDMVIRSPVGSLQSLGKAKQEIPGPITLSGVGDQKLV